MNYALGSAFKIQNLPNLNHFSHKSSFIKNTINACNNNKLNNIFLGKMFLEIKQFQTLLLEALSTTCRAFVKLFLPNMI